MKNGEILIKSSVSEPEREPIPGLDTSENNEDEEFEDDSDGDDSDDENDDE